MPPRTIERLVVVYLAIGALIALVAFIKVMLSPMLAVFVAGLGIGALGVVGLLAVTRTASVPYGGARDPAATASATVRPHSP
jgi:hypothetical protein